MKVKHTTFAGGYESYFNSSIKFFFIAKSLKVRNANIKGL